jgi:S-adenosylmethionine:tRNA ribosyltransferase-isomerase
VTGSLSGSTRLYITPGYRFRVVDALITNFHLPETTLLLLVSAFAGEERIRAAYQHAIEQRYRFYSFGDAMLIV